MSSLQWGKEKEDKPLDKQALINHMFSDKYPSVFLPGGKFTLAENIQCMIILAAIDGSSWKEATAQFILDEDDTLVQDLEEEVYSSEEIYEPILSKWGSYSDGIKAIIQQNCAIVKKDILLGNIIDLDNVLIEVRSNMPESAKGLLSRDLDIDALLFMCKYLPEIKNKVKLGE